MKPLILTLTSIIVAAMSAVGGMTLSEGEENVTHRSSCTPYTEDLDGDDPNLEIMDLYAVAETELSIGGHLIKIAHDTELGEYYLWVDGSPLNKPEPSIANTATHISPAKLHNKESEKFPTQVVLAAMPQPSASLLAVIFGALLLRRHRKSST